ncbi:MAG: hypothetical protein ACR2PO_20355 [Methyloligellaceae bacterium]
MTFAPVIGAPATVSRRLTAELTTAARQRRVRVVANTDKSAAYTIRGYLATSPDQRGSKVAYIWDVTDTAGKRVHRITGEQIVPAEPGGDPWAGVDSDVLNRIAGKTATNLAAWLPKQTATAGARTTTETPRARTESPRTRTETPRTRQSSPPNSQPPAQRPTRTAKANPKPGEFLTRVPAVTGAPGDGSKSLTLAIKKQLFKNGMKLTSSGGPRVYTVRGLVRVGRPADGKQSISINWQVLDPKGKRLGTVSQQNAIAQGSLDGPWGKTADAAAAAAASGIIKLLPKPGG